MDVPRGQGRGAVTFCDPQTRLQIEDRRAQCGVFCSKFLDFLL